MGFVDDSLDVLYKSSALIAPLFAGAGVKVKVIDAFTTGTPVIGTNIAFEGLPGIKDLVYLARKHQEYADIINSFSGISMEIKQKLVKEFKVVVYDNNHLADQL